MYGTWAKAGLPNRAPPLPAAVLLAVCVWTSRLRSRRVALLIDNTVALAAVRNGSSTAPDLSEMSHHLLKQLVSLDVAMVAFWVPSKLNLADAPSRGSPPVLGTQVELPLRPADLAQRCFRPLRP